MPWEFMILQNSSGISRLYQKRPNGWSSRSAILIQTVWKHVSALANSATFTGEKRAYLIFGIEDGSHNVVGTDIRIDQEKVGKDTFLFWLNGTLVPQINIEVASVDLDGRHIEILAIDPSYQYPVRFNGEAYIRIDTSLQPLSRHPERERAIWNITSRFSFEQAIARSHVTVDALYDHFEVHRLLTSLGVARPNIALAVDKMVMEDLILDNLQGGFDITNLDHSPDLRGRASASLRIPVNPSSTPRVMPRARRGTRPVLARYLRI